MLLLVLIFVLVLLLVLVLILVLVLSLLKCIIMSYIIVSKNILLHDIIRVPSSMSSLFSIKIKSL